MNLLTLSEPPIKLNKYLNRLRKVEPLKARGKVTQVIGLIIESQGPEVSVGELCYIYKKGEEEPISAEVVGFKENKVLLMPLGKMVGIHPGSEVVPTGTTLMVGVGEELLGRVVDFLGNPLDDKGVIFYRKELHLENSPPPPLRRRRITQPLSMGIRAIDTMLTIGKGQRIGVFAGSGVGKSTLLGMIARNTSADVNVIALIGERGREVRDFIEKDLQADGLARSVVVAVTSDQPALLRLKGALTATAIAEYFRDLGKDVNFMMDSVTRFAMAQREIGLAIGEPPTTRGFTPSVFALLPKLLERSGTSDKGSITGLYTVLVEADDMNEPISDAIRAILDGHIILSRELATMNHYPPIDVLSSVSRLMVDIVSQERRQLASKVRDVIATYQENYDLINIGAYLAGSNPKVDYAIRMIEPLNKFLKQEIEEKSDFEGAWERLAAIMAQ
jgi:flagellum-specific ATP synthase